MFPINEFLPWGEATAGSLIGEMMLTRGAVVLFGPDYLEGMAVLTR